MDIGQFLYVGVNQSVKEQLGRQFSVVERDGFYILKQNEKSLYVSRALEDIFAHVNWLKLVLDFD